MTNKYTNPSQMLVIFMNSLFFWGIFLWNSYSIPVICNNLNTDYYKVECLYHISYEKSISVIWHVCKIFLNSILVIYWREATLFNFLTHLFWLKFELGISIIYVWMLLIYLNVTKVTNKILELFHQKISIFQ